MSKTGKKTGKGNPPVEHQFKKGEVPQPTPEQKKAGRERKRHAAKIMDYILQYQTMTKKELEKKSKDENLTILELTLIRYVAGGMKNDKFLLDMIDRHVPKAPTIVEQENVNVELDISSKEKKAIKNMMNKKKEREETFLSD